MNAKKLTRNIVIAMVLGILVGWLCHEVAIDAAMAKDISEYFSLVTDIFLRLIKMVIAPLVFATLVSGLSSMSGSGAVGRIGLKAMVWFVTAAIISLSVGMFLANAFQPGAGLNMTVPVDSVKTGVEAAGFNLRTFVAHLVPTSIAEAMSKNEILQILIFSLFFGMGLAHIKSKGATTLFQMIDELANVMFKITDYVMQFAPLAVFTAIAASITVEGPGVRTALSGIRDSQ